jgi:predicted RNA-binding protein with TRAM domain
MNMEHEFKIDGKIEIIHKNGQPYGIRDAGGYLLFFPEVTKYTGQEQRYVEEIQESFALAEKIKKALTKI